MFTDFETKVFPESLCTLTNAREPEVKDCPQRFLCVLVDERFPEECHLQTLHPYTCPDIEDGSILYGWTDGNNVYDHFERDIHQDHQRVVAWKLVEEPVNFSKMLGHTP